MWQVRKVAKSGDAGALYLLAFTVIAFLFLFTFAKRIKCLASEQPIPLTTDPKYIQLTVYLFELLYS